MEACRDRGSLQFASPPFLFPFVHLAFISLFIISFVVTIVLTRSDFSDSKTWFSTLTEPLWVLVYRLKGVDTIIDSSFCIKHVCCVLVMYISRSISGSDHSLDKCRNIQHGCHARARASTGQTHLKV